MTYRDLLDIFYGKAKVGQKRSPKWPTFRKKWLAEHPVCAVCGGRKKLEAHHIIPFNMAPVMELDPSNLIALCESKKNGVCCHLLFGHLGDYQSYNETVTADALHWSMKLSKR